MTEEQLSDLLLLSELVTAAAGRLKRAAARGAYQDARDALQYLAILSAFRVQAGDDLAQGAEWLQRAHRN